MTTTTTTMATTVVTRQETAATRDDETAALSRGTNVNIDTNFCKLPPPARNDVAAEDDGERERGDARRTARRLRYVSNSVMSHPLRCSTPLAMLLPLAGPAKTLASVAPLSLLPAPAPRQPCEALSAPALKVPHTLFAELPFNGVKATPSRAGTVAACNGVTNNPERHTATAPLLFNCGDRGTTRLIGTRLREAVSFRLVKTELFQFSLISSRW